MTPTLQKLWSGQIAPYAEPDPDTEETRELRELIEKLTNDLCSCLNDKAKELFEKYNEAQANLNYCIVEDVFHRGFTLGAKITAEALIE
ncbi:MAG: hypothetical protein IJY27_00985 [Clostridia bacterium]|nr:hypothetical protein [Clostridia bacterium]